MLTFPALVAAYLDSIKVKPSHGRLVRIARQWVLTLPTVPTRAQLLMRQRELCAGHFKPNATKANKELALVRTACRWGQYEGVWTAGDPTAGIRKFKTPKRKRIGVHQELRSLLEQRSQSALSAADIPRPLRVRNQRGDAHGIET